MKCYIAAVPYTHQALDFEELLKDVPDISVSRSGRRRRVQMDIGDEYMEDVRMRLPKYVILEVCDDYVCELE